MSATAPVTVWFYRGPEGLFGWLIRIFTLSRYSHCEIQVGMFTFSADPGAGVTMTLGKPHMDEHWDGVRVAVEDTDGLTHWLMARDGRGYDWSGILLSEMLPFELDSDRRFYCSELVRRALQTFKALAKPWFWLRWSPGRLAARLSKGD